MTRWKSALVFCLHSFVLPSSQEKHGHTDSRMLENINKMVLEINEQLQLPDFEAMAQQLSEVKKCCECPLIITHHIYTADLFYIYIYITMKLYFNISPVTVLEISPLWCHRVHWYWFYLAQWQYCQSGASPSKCQYNKALFFNFF